ncbi:MAG TPA: tetratricopeptide repeat protein [Aggregatilineaceae bacterium]|nr:tetratricopeptide repeat protein [Aggregatilineaceae bacterium]
MDWLSRAIELVKAGKLDEARQALLQILRENPGNETAWLWLAQTFQGDAQRIEVLEQCLKCIPGSQKARQGLEFLRSRRTEAAPSAPQATPKPVSGPSGIQPQPLPAPVKPVQPAPEKTKPEPPQARKNKASLTPIDIGAIALIAVLVLALGGYFLWASVFNGGRQNQAGLPLLPASLPALAVEPTRTDARLTPSPVPATHTPLISLTPTSLPATPTPTTSLTPTPDLRPRSILFLDETTCVVKRVDAAGGQPLPLTKAPLPKCMDGKISPDGRKVYFLVDESAAGESDYRSLYVMNVDGSERLAIVKHVKGLSPLGWSPDSTTLAYYAYLSESLVNTDMFSLTFIHADGTGMIIVDDLRNDLSNPFVDFYAWSPDGQWLAIQTYGGTYIVRTDGSGLKRLSDDSSANFVAWSPNSRQIAFYSKYYQRPGIVILDVSGVMHLIRSSQLENKFDGIIAWAPDGLRVITQIVFHSPLVLVSMDGQIAPFINGVIDLRQVVVSPDGRQLAVLDQPDSQNVSLLVVNMDGSGLKTLASGVRNIAPVWSLAEK